MLQNKKETFILFYFSQHCNKIKINAKKHLFYFTLNVQTA